MRDSNGARILRPKHCVEKIRHPLVLLLDRRFRRSVLARSETLSSQFDVGMVVLPDGVHNQAFLQSWSDLIKKLDQGLCKNG